MSELDNPGTDDAGTPEFDAMVLGWPDRVTALSVTLRAGSSDAVTIVSEVPVPRPSFTPHPDVRATGSMPALQ
jgi:hypothetical protein